MTILHIEDDDNDALLLAKACERARLPAILHRVADAGEGKSFFLGEGIYADRLKYPLPQIIILDLKMPGVTGFEFLTWFRMQTEFVGIPVLVFTSSLSRDDKSRALAEGATSFFVKPASFDALVQMVGMFQMPDSSPLN
ncbi:MAG: response regulator [Akkermansiaceae bacterium]|nr:response regulator [Verrucomicrobiales bacterium]